jgi:Spy/CpxP family protein refolding chaperone
MKKILIAGGVLSIVVFLTPMLWAGSGSRGRGMGFYREIEPEMFSTLNLADEQKQILQELRDNYLKNKQLLQNQIFSKKAELRMLWDTSSSDHEKFAVKHKEISALCQQLNQMAMQYRTDCRDVLTPEQQANLAETTTAKCRPRWGGKKCQ